MENTHKKPWYKKWWVIVLGIIILLIIIGGSGNDSSDQSSSGATNEQTSTAPVQEKTYQQVFTFSGSGGKKSEPFTITGSRFKIKYTCNNVMICSASLYKVGNQLPAGLIMNTTEAVSDETIFYGSGEYYIDASMSVGNYSMIVEDYR